MVRMRMIPKRPGGLVDRERPPPSGAGFDPALRSAVRCAGDEQTVPMDRRGCVERILHRHLDVISATEAKGQSEDRSGIAERLRGFPFEKLMEAGRRPELDDVVLSARVDQWWNGKVNAATGVLAYAHTGTPHSPAH